MTKIESSVVIDRSVEDVWKFITDVANGPKWDEGLTEWKQTSAGSLGVGTTLQAIHPKLTYSERVVGSEPNRMLSLEITSGPAMESVGTLSMESIESKTKLTESTDYRFSGLYNLVGPFLTRTARGETSSRVGNVKRILESKANSEAEPLIPTSQ